MSEFVICEKSDLVNVADAIREKTGKADEMTLDQMAVEIAGISGGGDTTQEDGIVEQTITEYTNNRVTKVGQNTFRNWTNLRSVSMKECTEIESDAFSGCTNLSSVFFPSLTYIKTRGFCQTGLVEVTDANFPKLTNLIQSFNNCASLKRIVLPNTGYIANSQTGCTSLEYAEYAKAQSIKASAFNGCTVFDTLVLRNNALVTLANVNAFNGTPFASGGTGGTVYVHQALITQYQQATNWSTLYAAGTCNFVAVEGSEYE